MGWLNWNSDPRDDENETEIRGAMIASVIMIAVVCFMAYKLMKD